MLSSSEVTRCMRMKLETSLLLNSWRSLRARGMYNFFSYYLYVFLFCMQELGLLDALVGLVS
jgi:hypothetical protein